MPVARRCRSAAPLSPCPQGSWATPGKEKPPRRGSSGGSRSGRRCPEVCWACGARRGEEKPIAHFCDVSWTIREHRHAVKKIFLGIFALFLHPSFHSVTTGGPPCPRRPPSAGVGQSLSHSSLSMIPIKAGRAKLWPTSVHQGGPQDRRILPGGDIHLPAISAAPPVDARALPREGGDRANEFTCPAAPRVNVTFSLIAPERADALCPNKE